MQLDLPPALRWFPQVPVIVSQSALDARTGGIALPLTPSPSPIPLSQEQQMVPAQMVPSLQPVCL